MGPNAVHVIPEVYRGKCVYCGLTEAEVQRDNLSPFDTRNSLKPSHVRAPVVNAGTDNDE